MAKASSRRSRFESRTMAKHSKYNATKVRQGAIVFNGPLELAVFMAGLFGSVALLLIALLLHL
ncbi:MAG TPA: hypothetical protein VN718_04465 [Rhizomicrobium sp.]|nr:hypothetical protein [Rhizomicrobium sp.]